MPEFMCSPRGSQLFSRPQVIAKRRARAWTVVVMCNAPSSPGRRAEDLQRWIYETLRDPTLVKEVCRMAGPGMGGSSILEENDGRWQLDDIRYNEYEFQLYIIT